MHSWLLYFKYPCGQQYIEGSGRRRTYVFCLPPLPPRLLLLCVTMMDTWCAIFTIIFISAAILFKIMALKPLSVALACVSLEKAFWLLSITADRSDQASSVSVWYTCAGVWKLLPYTWLTTALYLSSAAVVTSVLNLCVVRRSGSWTQPRFLNLWFCSFIPWFH